MQWQRVLGRPGHAPARRQGAHRRQPDPRQPARHGRKAGGRRPSPATDHRAGGRRPRQAPDRPRLAGRRLIMRRTTLAILVASAVALLAPAAAQALNVYAATSLRDVFPAIDRRRRTASAARTRCSCRSSAARPPTCSRRPARRRRRRSSARACCTRPVTFATNRLVLLVPNANPGNDHARSTRCAPAGAARRRHRRACRSAPTRASCSRACGCRRSSARNTVSQRDQRRPASPPRSRSARPTPASSTTPTGWRRGPHAR